MSGAAKEVVVVVKKTAEEGLHLIQQLARKAHIERLFKQMDNIQQVIKVVGPTDLLNIGGQVLRSRLRDLDLAVQKAAKEWGW